jgi:pilus assembly protein FimV
MVSEGESALDKPLSLDEAFETDLDSDVEGLDIDSLSTDAVSSDAVATKLDLAKAFVEMGDSDGARDILNEVTKEGNEEQRREAEALLGELA